MRPHEHAGDGHRLRGYRDIIDRYLRYVLIRCLAYTNERTLAERITAYTLITTCPLVDRLRRRADLGSVIDMIVQMVGEDQISNGEFQVSSGKCQGGRFTLQTSDFQLAADAFALDARMCEAAGAINGVRRLGRQLLVLHHVEGIDVGGLAGIYALPPGRIEKAMGKAEREFIGILSGLSSWGTERRRTCRRS